MIITQLNGGLGNQMFQYAAACALAERLGEEVGLDTRIVEGTSERGYGLHHFAISGRILRPEVLPPDRRTKRLGYLAWRAGLIGPRLLRQNGDDYDARIETAGKNTYLKGYWQSERFFAAACDRVRREFQIVTPPSPQNAEIAEEINSQLSVSVHVRRGDYLSDARANAVHGTCEIEYYAAALEMVIDHVQADVTAYVFSDDPAWVQENFILPCARRVVDLNDSAHQYEDMRLMALCRHNIIAYSSFSWWGAWLNPRPDKVVVAPTTWFRDPKKHNPSICPETWLRC